MSHTHSHTHTPHTTPAGAANNLHTSSPAFSLQTEAPALPHAHELKAFPSCLCLHFLVYKMGIEIEPTPVMLLDG